MAEGGEIVEGQLTNGEVLDEKIDLSIVQGSEPVYDFYCELCKEDGTFIEAEGFCSDCNDYLCQTCSAHHRRTRHSRHHRVLSKEDMPKDVPIPYDKVSEEITVKCVLHNSKLVEFYCQSHESFGCSTCFIIYHRECQGVSTILELSSTLDGQELDQLMAEFLLIGSRSRGLNKEAETMRDRAEKKYLEALDTIDQTKESIKQSLDAIESNLKRDLKNVKDKEVKHADSILERSTDILKSSEEIIEKFRDLKESKKVCQIYIALKEDTKYAESITRKLDEVENDNKIQHDNKIQDVSFKPNSIIIKYINSHDVLGSLLTPDEWRKAEIDDRSFRSKMYMEALEEQIGNKMHIGARKENSLSPSLCKIKPNHEKPAPARYMHQEPVGNVMQLQATPSFKCSNININHIFDIDSSALPTLETHNITGCAVLSSDRLVVVSHKGSSVSLIDTLSLATISTFKITPTLWDVVTIGHDKIAVTHTSRSIYILKVTDDQITEEREILLRHKCRGIAYSNSRLVLASTHGILILNANGEEIKNIDNEFSGRQLFGQPRYVCVGNDNETIYVSDYSEHKIVVVAFDGTLQSVIRDDYMRGPEKCCVSNNGHIFLCGRNSDSIHMLTPGCSRMKTILKDVGGKMGGPLSICHCQETDKLYVGMDRYRVKIYQLS